MPVSFTDNNTHSMLSLYRASTDANPIIPHLFRPLPCTSTAILDFTSSLTHRYCSSDVFMSCFYVTPLATYPSMVHLMLQTASFTWKPFGCSSTFNVLNMLDMLFYDLFVPHYFICSTFFDLLLTSYSNPRFLLQHNKILSTIIYSLQSYLFYLLYPD